MRIHHVAIWTADLERLRGFYCRHLGAISGGKYRNDSKGYESYFLEFSSGASLELMCLDSFKDPKPDRAAEVDRSAEAFLSVPGYAHFALAVADPASVDGLAERLRHEGVRVIGEPRCTGDGYYEAVLLDPDGNRVEIVSEKRPGVEGKAAALEGASPEGHGDGT